ncbi:hypothetical protein, partial [Vibrio cholerae]|uniref:hypothetical protein n=1 Tax=Vibrio cholerae TaxID=666 RepID=UPI003075C8F4
SQKIRLCFIFTHIFTFAKGIKIFRILSVNLESRNLVKKLYVAQEKEKSETGKFIFISHKIILFNEGRCKF